MIKVMGQPWCGESVRIVKLGHLGLVEVPHNPVHVILILREDFPFPQKHQQDLVLFCYLSRPCVAWGGPAIGWKSLNISLMIRFLNIDLIWGLFLALLRRPPSRWSSPKRLSSSLLSGSLLSFPIVFVFSITLRLPREHSDHMKHENKINIKLQTIILVPDALIS